jgi:hypothetical protein
LYAPAPISDEAIVQHLCIRQSGKFKPAQLVKVVRRVVASYCYSGDPEFEVKHIPYWYAISCDATTQAAAVEFRPAARSHPFGALRAVARTGSESDHRGASGQHQGSVSR